ncbi:hypothetical protein [Paracoccus shandongensis]|uniref:hypothetical protein n=1 Tax=Paracoccus shandongensis TaxID=2816048 RepID=UPI001A903CA8|nr:hypothetical protein [Paracoccus shandongensis]
MSTLPVFPGGVERCLGKAAKGRKGKNLPSEKIFGKGSKRPGLRKAALLAGARRGL